MSLQLNGDTGVTFNDASLQGAAASPFGLKNRIINGDMRIDQRNAGASVTPTNGQYTLDRWKCFLTQSSKFSVQQDAAAVTPPVGFNDYLGATSLSAYSVLTSDYFIFNQYIEGYNIADLAWGTANAKTVTLSFWARSSLTGTFGGVLKNAAGNRSYPFTYTISSANTWELKSVTITGDTTGTWLTTNGVGIELAFSLGAGSSVSGTAGAWGSNLISATGATSVVGTNGATFYITGVQLEVGSTATPFERRLYSNELINCQRYYYKSVASGGNATSMMSPGPAYTTVNSAQHYCAFPVTMRVTPTASVSSVSLYAPGLNTAITAIATQNSSTTQGTLNFTVASGLTYGEYYTPITASGYLDFSAEL
jgi:hypothetical protein